MLDSVRVRLTLWYTGVLALVLVVLSVATYFIYWKNTVQRADSNLAELSDAFVTTLYAELGNATGFEEMENAAKESIVEHRFRDHVFALLDASGNVVVSSQDLPVAPPVEESSPSGLLKTNSFRKFVEVAGQGDRVFRDVRGGRDGYRGFARHVTLNGKIFTVVVLQSLHPQQEMLDDVVETFSWMIPIALLLASVGGYFLARKSLAPVVNMAAQAGRIGAANLHARLVVHNEKDELGRLAASFNGLLNRLDESFERQRRFMADASHELRTPVAILRGEAEVALSRPERAPEEYRESLAVLRDESQRLTHIVEDLFTLARADAGQHPLSLSNFYLEELVGDCLRTTRTLALAKQISLGASVAGEMPILADEGLLRRMLLNLLDNAIKYTPQRGAVTVSCSVAATEYALSVTDTGAGVPAELQGKIFERFFRADKARSRAENDGGGAGLGLSIARWIAEEHHGRLELSRSDSSGSVFTVFLPVAR
jgi:two-component system, OmpR family, sensor kinase